MPMRSALEDRNRVAGSELHDCLLCVWTTSDGLADAPRLAARIRCPDSDNLHPEELLDGRPNGVLVGIRSHLKRVFAAILVRGRCLLRDDRADNCAMQC